MPYMIAFSILVLESVTMIAMLMLFIHRRKAIWHRMGPVLYISTCTILLILPFFLASIANISWNMMT